MAEQGFINILVAEDNEVSREMMAGVLRAQGYRVYGAIDGESAIKVVEDRTIDLAIVDINMAPKGGFEFVKYLVVKGIDVPVVLITGDESSHILVEATQLGVAKISDLVDAASYLARVNRPLLRPLRPLRGRPGTPPTASPSTRPASSPSAAAPSASPRSAAR